MLGSRADGTSQCALGIKTRNARMTENGWSLWSLAQSRHERAPALRSVSWAYNDEMYILSFVETVD